MAAAFMQAASTEVASMVVVEDAGDRMYPHVELVELSRMEGNTMLQQFSILVQRKREKIVRFAASVLFSLSLGSSFAPTFAQQPGQQTFSSPEDAGRAFFAAMQAPTEQSLLNILGPAGKEIVSSGDPAEDLDARTGFVVKYQEMHRFVTEPDGTVTLVAGAENWPLPIPLVHKNGAWYFDTEAGNDEILFRRIGKNELAAMQACVDLVDAQNQYYARAPYGFGKQYAQKLVSEGGRHDGLYWEETGDQFNSPINPLIANAAGRGPKDQVGDPVPFNGYYFRILTSQGSHAPGGAKDYVTDGKMSSGFAFVAYPAEYRSSGVMTFIVNKSGAIYEKDLGPDTTALAEAMTAYDPDSTWHRVE
jgi:hypothetical protein